MPDPTLPVNLPADAAADLRARHGRDVVDRAHEAIVGDAPDLDGDAYDRALAAACERIAAIDAAADLADVDCAPVARIDAARLERARAGLARRVAVHGRRA